LRGKVAVAVLVLTLTGCGDSGSDLFTWGDACDEYAAGWCGLGQDCGASFDHDVCLAHTKSHCCELWGSCEDPEGDEVAVAVAECTAAMQDPSEGTCVVAVHWGLAPPECEDFAVLYRERQR